MQKVDAYRPLGRDLPWPAPAKLNLCLHIVGRRSDGYHLLQTAMQPIDLCDELRFFAAPEGTVERLAGPADVPVAEDLTVRAARLLQQVTATTQGVAIELTKRIPMGAGLGGGSSDAATVLVALNLLWNLGLSVDELAAHGLTLGADVPFFVRCHAAWAEGVGEILTACPFPETTYLVIKPRVNVQTAQIFRASELTRNTPLTTIRAFLAEGGRNDCTATVRQLYPEVAAALDWLQNHGEAKLTGTGACVFAAFADAERAAAVRAQLPSSWLGYIVHGLNQSPLLARVAAERSAAGSHRY